MALLAGFRTMKGNPVLFSVSILHLSADNYGIEKQKKRNTTYSPSSYRTPRAEPTVLGSETENKTRFAFIIQKPASCASDSDGSFLFAA